MVNLMPEAIALAHRLYGHVVNKELRAVNNDLFAVLQPTEYCVFIAHGVAQAYWNLMRNVMAILVFCDIDKRLTAQARNCQNRYDRHGRGAPNDAGLH